MDGEPGFAEHGCESKPGKAKTIKLTDYTSIGGQFSLGTFFVCTKKVPRFSGSEKNTILLRQEGKSLQ